MLTFQLQPASWIWPNAENIDRFHKILPIIDGFSEWCRHVYNPGRYLTIAESLVLWGGRLISRQTICLKRAWVGIKMYPLCTHYVVTLSFRIYTARDIPSHSNSNLLKNRTTDTESNESIPRYGSSSLYRQLLHKCEPCPISHDTSYASH